MGLFNTYNENNKSIVYFKRKITPESVVALYNQLGKTLGGKVVVKLHSSKQGNQNFLRPEFWKEIIEFVN